MVTDTEPRYRLVDADGNVVGSLFAESDGTLKLQEGTSGNDNEFSFSTAGRVNVKSVTESLTFAAGFDGSGADARLDAALSAATAGTTIILEPTNNYTTARTISKRISLVGTSPGFGGTVLNGDITVGSDEVTISQVALFSNVTFNAPGTRFTDAATAGSGSLTVAADDCIVTNVQNGGSITFSAGTAGGVASAISGPGSVSDNGANTLGDGA